MISIVNTECHVPKTFSDLAIIAAWGRLGLYRAGDRVATRCGAAHIEQAACVRGHLERRGRSRSARCRRCAAPGAPCRRPRAWAGTRAQAGAGRQEASRGGEGGERTCRLRGTRDHEQKKKGG